MQLIYLGMQKIDLAALIAPVQTQDFFDFHWPHKPLFVPANPEKLKALFELPQLQSLEALIAARVLKVRACLPDFDDEYSSIQLEPNDALKAFNNSMTLVFDAMQTQNALIAQTLKNIREDLGLVTGGEENNLCIARSIAYATPAGAGTRLHFDANANFIIQISGSKTWMLAANNSVSNPTERFTTGALEMPAALEKQCHAPLIDDLPEDSIEFLMEAGSVLYVPRGYWHATTADEDSLSLNFTFSQPTWADVFTKSLQEYLLSLPDWRELADGLEAQDEERKALAVKKFTELFKKISTELPELNAKQLLEESGLLA